MYNILVWDNGKEQALIEVVTNNNVIYSTFTFNLFGVISWVYDNCENANCDTVKVIYK